MIQKQLIVGRPRRMLRRLSLFFCIGYAVECRQYLPSTAKQVFLFTVLTLPRHVSGVRICYRSRSIKDSSMIFSNLLDRTKLNLISQRPQDSTCSILVLLDPVLGPLTNPTVIVLICHPVSHSLPNHPDSRWPGNIPRLIWYIPSLAGSRETFSSMFTGRLKANGLSLSSELQCESLCSAGLEGTLN